MSERDQSRLKAADIRRSPGVSYQKLLDADTRPVPAHLRIDTAAFLGDHDIPVERYIDPKFHELEKEKLWPKVWQVALLEERIPEVGDADVYEINDISIMLVRVAPDEIKGYYNACLHMGRNLIDRPCNKAEIRFPYHGFTWRIDGKLKHIPGMWDFPHVDPQEMNLPEVKVALWNGFVFINMDPNCEPLETYLGEAYSHWDNYSLADRYTAVHVCKVISCNWKVGQEAFMDAFHLVASHPQILAAAGDDNTQYDIFGNCSRAITPAGTPSPHLNWTPTENEIAANVYKPRDSTGGVEVPEGMTYRQHGAQVGREELREVIGDKADGLCDSEVMDSFYYTLFPNFHPYLAYNQVLQRFKPYGDRHDMCTMEVMYLSPFKGERPPPAKPTFLGPDESFLDAHELGAAGALISQDEWNLEKVQKGLHTLRVNKPGITMGIYQHTQVRHFHNIYERYLGLDR
ncbi:MAG: aromatic ring-hydroxylating dioxygenase subunit alpha [Novosphingobium sp.]|nr:aromatic ring-hydroxylating dioxygenase subunit alpha [Novosphingobium sp.]